MNFTAALAEITETLDSAEEWLIVRESGKSFALRESEIEFTVEREKLFCGFLDDQGFQIWRIAAFQIKDKNLTIDATRNFGRTRERIKFVRRVSSEELNVQIELPRLEKANQIAALIVSETPNTKLVKVALNTENGRFAEIVFEDFAKKQIAALADVSDSLSPETLLTTAIFRLNELQTRRKNQVNEIQILAEKKIYGNLRKLHALLNENWQSKISIKEISCSNDSIKTERIISRKNLRIGDLWRDKP